MIRNCLKAASSKTYEALQHPENQIKWVGEMILKSKSELNDVYIYIYPPTPALAKAGAAPGTTAGVELLLLSFPRPLASP